MDWNITPVRVPITYLRVTLHCVYDVLAIMGTRPLSATLRSLHVKLRDDGPDRRVRVAKITIAFSMLSLRTFTFVKSLYRHFPDE